MDDYDESSGMTEAIRASINAFNKEMDDAGVLKLACGQRRRERYAPSRLSPVCTSVRNEARKQKFLDGLSNSGPAVRLYGEGKATFHPMTTTGEMEKS